MMDSLIEENNNTLSQDAMFISGSIGKRLRDRSARDKKFYEKGQRKLSYGKILKRRC